MRRRTALFFMAASFDAMLLVDARGFIMEANAAAARLLWRPIRAMRGKAVRSIVGIRWPVAAPSSPARRENVDVEGTVCKMRRAGHPDATVVLRRTRNDSGDDLWVLRDVTQSRSAADALEQRNRLLMEAERVGRMGAWEFDIKTGLLVWTAELQRLMGLEGGSTLTVEKSNTFYSDVSGAIVREAFKATVKHGTPYDLELEVITGHGRRLWVREVCRATFRRGQLVAVVGVLQDISEARRMADLLAESADLERARIGADLHDGLGQELTGLALLLDAAAGRQRRLKSSDAEDLVALSVLARKAIQSLRTLTHRMLPLELRQWGFRRVCLELAQSTRTALGIAVSFRFPGNSARVPVGPTAEHLYRIIQETIANAVKHGGATRIALTLRCSDTKLLLTVTDDGAGIDMRNGTDGVGLQIMRYRARLLGGLLDIEPLPRGGTRVRCVVPRVGVV